MLPNYELQNMITVENIHSPVGHQKSVSFSITLPEYGKSKKCMFVITKGRGDYGFILLLNPAKYL